MNGTNWTERQWNTYEFAKISIPAVMLESLILAAEAHSLGMRVSKTQKARWLNMARRATKEMDEVLAEIEAI